MTIQEYYDLIEGGFWKEEPTNAMMDSNDVYLFLFHQPTHNLPGTYIFDYRKKGRLKRETGTYSIEVRESAVLIKIDDHYFQLYFEDDGTKMIWRSALVRRVFNLTEELSDSDNLYKGSAIRIE